MPEFSNVEVEPREHAGHEGPLHRLVEELTPTVADEILPELAQPEAQTYLLKVLLPQIRDHMAHLCGLDHGEQMDAASAVFMQAAAAALA